MDDRHDDEGLIDLRTLSVPPRHGASAQPPAFSLGNELPPAGAFASDTPAVGWKAHKQTIGLAVAATAFVVLSGFGVAFAFRGEKAVTPPLGLTNSIGAPPAVSVASAAPSMVAASPVSDSAASQPGSTDDDDDADDSSSAKPKMSKARKGRGHAGKGRSTAPAKVKRSKPSDPCHCHGDFQCNIRCSANFKR